MMLWNIIRDFFVQYIFGGTLSDGILVLEASLGTVTFSDYSNDIVNTGSLSLPFNGYDAAVQDSILYYTVGDYLSTTATIIVLVVLAIVVTLGIRWLFRFMISRFTKWGL